MNYRKINLPFVSLIFCVCACAQVARDDPASLRQMLKTQPDDTAMRRFSFSEVFGGFGATGWILFLMERG